MHATKAAVEEGIVPGGGIALLRAARALATLKLPADQQVGVAIIARAVEEPLRWIANNAGEEGSVVMEKVKDMGGEDGFNAQTATYENLVSAGGSIPRRSRSGAAERRLDPRHVPDDRGARGGYLRGD
jgi:chaperonin GroEL